MTTLLPFLRVPDVAATIAWYESIGFTCTGTHQEPGCELDWAMIRLEDAAFMLYGPADNTIHEANNCGLYFYKDSITGWQQKLEGKARIIEVMDETTYGRKEITFHDCKGFQVTFSCSPGA